MELSWSTFILEMINFLVLVWILKRFLYKPVLEVIERRKASIEQSLSDAKTLQQDAEQLQQQYQRRLADWNAEKQKSRDALQQALETERAQRLEALQQELEQERARADIANQRRLADSLYRNEETALKQGAQFATRLLTLAAGPELETRLVEMVIGELEQLPEERIQSLRNHDNRHIDNIHVTSVYPLSETQQQQLDQSIARIAGHDAEIHFEQDADLIAGLRLTLGAWVLGANLRDELKAFSELAQKPQQDIPA